MDMVEVLDGQVSELDDSFFNRSYEADDATPFPLQAVLKRLWVAALYNDDLSRDVDVMELAVLFSNTFGDSISVQRVHEAQATVNERIARDDTDDVSGQTAAMQELVAAYGRDYAFTNSSFRRQYDAAKWHTTLGLYHFGDWLIDASTRIAERARPAGQTVKARLTGAVRSRLPARDAPAAGGDTRVYDPDADAEASDDRAGVQAD